MNDIKFSIAIPCYKKRYLFSAIESCLCQTYCNFEVVIVNDSSPEDIDSVVNLFKDNRIKYYKNSKNSGALNVVDNWNICLSYCTGDYVICMGDDDRLLPCCLNEYVKLIRKYPNVKLFHAWTQIINESSKIINMQESRPEFESSWSFLWHRWCLRKHQYIGDFLFNTSELRNNGGFYKLPYAWGSDDISAFIASLTFGVVNTQVPCFQYRESSISITSTLNIYEKAEAVLLEKKWYEEILQNTNANTEQDSIFKELILTMKEGYYKKRFKTMLKQDLYLNSFHVVKWLKNSSFGLSKIYIVKSLFSCKKDSFKDFLKNII